MADFTREQLLHIIEKGTSDDGKTLLRECVYEAMTETSQEMEWHRVGEPVTNCTPGATQPVTSQIGATRTDTEIWSVGGSVGINFGEDLIAIEGKADYQKSRSMTTERRDTVVAQPGKKNALTLGTGWVTQTGRLRVVVKLINPSTNVADNTLIETLETLYVDDVTRRVPNGYTEKGQNEVGCDSKFTVDPEP